MFALDLLFVFCHLKDDSVFSLFNTFSTKPYIIIITTCKVPSLSAVAEAREKGFFLNRSTHESFYVIELSFFFFFLSKAEFLPRTMKISQNVSKMGDIVRSVERKTENLIPLLIFLVTAKKNIRDRKLKIVLSENRVNFRSKHM